MKKIILTLVGFILFIIIANFFNYSYFILIIGFVIILPILLFEIKNNKKNEKTSIFKVLNFIFYILFIIIFLVLIYNYCIYFFEVKQIQKYIKNSKEIKLNDRAIKEQNKFKKEFLNQIDLINGKIYNFNEKPNFILVDQDMKKLNLYVTSDDKDCSVYVYIKDYKVIKMEKNKNICSILLAP